MKKQFHSVATVGVILACFAGSTTSADELAASAALAAASSAARYMVETETADGRFLYEFDFLEGQFLDDDNIVRQAGGAYGLNEYVYVTRDPAIVEPARRAIGYAQSHSVAYGAGQLVSADGTVGKGSPGATALATLAAIYSLRFHEDPDLRAMARKWIAGLEAAQLPSSGFPNSVDKAEQDPYGSGESWLALAHWAEIEPGDTAAAVTLQRADTHLMDDYKNHTDTQFFHWGAQAAAERFKTTGDMRFVKFLEDQVAEFLSDAVATPRPLGNNCAAVEGLVAAVNAFNRVGVGAAVGGLAEERVLAELKKSLTMQIQPGQSRVTFDADRYYQDSKIANFAGGFLNGGAELRMRIDLTQHCLSALVSYAQAVSR